MPELPEVETVMRGLAARIMGRVITESAIHRADLRWTIPAGLAERLQGARVLGLRRRAKYILMRLAARPGEAPETMLLHLGMSGRIAISQTGRPAANEHLTLRTDDGWRIAFIDPRRFGMVDLMPTEAEDRHRLLCHLGPEPLDAVFTPDVLAPSLAGRRTPIKASLLDQRIVAGLGNIYVCEALFDARIGPARLAGTLTRAEIARLVPAIKSVLERAIAAGGSSLRDYVQPSGELGYFQHAWRVYGRTAQPCTPACPGTPTCAGVQRIVQAGRSTFYCPRRQG